jgi:murein DD-endopeptidase MepM/ murein hydrolase activator NlpD
MRKRACEAADLEFSKTKRSRNKDDRICAGEQTLFIVTKRSSETWVSRRCLAKQSSNPVMGLAWAISKWSGYIRLKDLFAVLLVLTTLMGSAYAFTPERSRHLEGAGGWTCASWLKAGLHTSGGQAGTQWIIGFLSGRIEVDSREIKFFGPDQIRTDARRFCRSHLDELVDDAAREIYSKALARGCQCAGRDANSIYSSLQELAAAHQLPSKVAETLVGIYSYQNVLRLTVDPSDFITVLYDGPSESRQLLFAQLILNGKVNKIYRFQLPDGGTSYYDETGKSMQTEFSRVPMQADHGTLAGGFGYRIDQRNRTMWHQGVDWQAPTGTPVITTGDGIIEYVGQFGRFGNGIRILHSDGYETFYAHLAGFAHGINVGVQVRQGQIIGYVGSTGVSSRPHLHYEVRLHDLPVDPLSAEFPHKSVLEGALLEDFQRERTRIDARLAEEAREYRLWKERNIQLR